jgi:hypothetical protein
VDSTASKMLWAAAATVVAALAALAATLPSPAGAGYVRPKGASPITLPMVPIFERCDWEGGGRRSDTVHGPGLTDEAGNPLRACKDPELVSGTLTIGTPDANGKPVNSMGRLTFRVRNGRPETPADEADVLIDFEMTDVRLQQGLGDYPGTMLMDLDTRLTDLDNGPAGGPFDEAGTLKDSFYWKAPINCAPTSSTTIGSTCTMHTTADTILPGMIKEGRRTIWEHADHPHIRDGGPDWNWATEDDNLVFATSGYFVP